VPDHAARSHSERAVPSARVGNRFSAVLRLRAGRGLKRGLVHPSRRKIDEALFGGKPSD
jgi:hypothetical protein